MNLSRDTKILITGATGFVGSNLIRILNERGFKDITAIVLPNDDIKRIKSYNIKITYGDIVNKDSLYKILKGKEVIIHLAAVIGSTAEDLNESVNFIGTKNLIQVIEDLNLNLVRFLFASSIAASGPTEKGKLKTENDKENPVSVYGRTKLKAERFLIKKRDMVPITILRFPLIFGPGSIGGVLPLIKAINNNLFPLLPDNETNIAFVDDIANGIIDSINSNNTIGEIFFIGENKIYNSRLFLQNIKKIMNKFTIKIPFYPFLLYGIATFSELTAKILRTKPFLRKKNLNEYLKHRFWGVKTQKAIEYFNYKTKYSIEEGLKITIDWYRENNLI